MASEMLYAQRACILLRGIDRPAARECPKGIDNKRLKPFIIYV